MDKIGVKMITTALLVILIPGFAMSQIEGLHLYQQGRYFEALRYFNSYLEEGNKKTPALTFYLGNTCLELAELTESLHQTSCQFGKIYYQQQLAKKTPSPALYYYYGLCLTGLNDYSGALKSFRKVSKKKTEYHQRAKIWEQALNGKKNSVQETSLKLEDLVAAVETQKRSDVNLSMLRDMNPAEFKNLFDQFNYLILLVAAGEWTTASGYISALSDEEMLLKLDSELIANAVSGDHIEYIYYNPLVLKYLSKY